MDQPEEVLEKLERFNVQKNPEITRELDEYVSFVARTGESVFNWALVKRLYREKLINVITEFNEASTKELPVYPNVDPFNYETMKKMLIERLDSFNAAPFTIQRISELLADPRKQYSRIDKFMRAVEKNILVVSTVSPGRNRSEESENENGDSLDSVGLNGDFSSDVNVDIDMENDNEGTFNVAKENNTLVQRKEENLEIVTKAVTNDAATIKKTEEESSSSTVAADSAETMEENTQANAALESQSAVIVTLCESNKDVEPSVSSEDHDKTKSPEIVEQKLAEENSEISRVIKTSDALLPIIGEPKIDEDALLNEPLRPADDEILVDTAPLAALENIVANRTVIDETPRIEEQLQKSEEHSVAEEQTVSSEQEKQTEKIESVEDEASNLEKIGADDSEIATKRRKLNTNDDADSAPHEESLTTTSAEVFNEDKEQNVEKLPEEIISTPIDEQPSDEQSQTQSQEEQVSPAEEEKSENAVILSPVIENIPAENISTEKEALVDSNIAVEEESIVIEQHQPLANSEQEHEMESAPIAENQMALDEEVSETVEPTAEMDVAPLAASKMDTDNDTENALMDVDDDEPMDQ